MANNGPAKAVPKVSLISSSPAPPAGELDAFIQGMRDLGYVDGQNVNLLLRYDIVSPAEASAAAAEAVEARPDVIVADGDPRALAAKRLTSTIPIVFALSFDPVGLGLVESLARPGGNVTGLSGATVQASGRTLEFGVQLLPGLSRMGVMWEPGDVISAALFKSVQQAAPLLGISLQPYPASRLEEYEGVFEAAVAASLPALWLVPSVLLQSGPGLPRSIELAIKYRLPTLGGALSASRGQVIVGYGINILEQRRRAANYVDRILKGAKPADLPVEEPNQFELVINMQLAQAIGVTVPPVLLAQVTQVIQ
jgi:putative ABC transport system substrate-binding protein